MRGPRSRLGKLARFLGITQWSKKPLPPAWIYWALAAFSLVVGIDSILQGGRVGVAGWGLVVVGTPLMVLIARRPRS